MKFTRRRTSDIEFVERRRKLLKNRRGLAIFYLCYAIAICVLMGWIWAYHNPSPFIDGPDEQWAYEFGIFVTSVILNGLWCAFLLVILGWKHLFGFRELSLLIEYYDRLQKVDADESN